MQFPLTPEEQSLVESYRAGAPAQGGGASTYKATPKTTQSSGDDSAFVPSADNQTPPPSPEAQAGSAGVTQSGGGFWSSISHFFGSLFYGGN